MSNNETASYPVDEIQQSVDRVLSDIIAPPNPTELPIAYNNENGIKCYETTDTSGFKRQIYVFGTKEILFKGREEAPDVAGFSTSESCVEHEPPRLHKELPDLVGASDHLIVNQTPFGFTEAAIAVGAQPERFSQMQDEIKNNVYSADALQLIDMILACRLNVDAATLQPANFADPRAEAHVLASLLGDPEANKEVAKRVQALDAADRISEINARNDIDTYNVDEAMAYKPEDLLLVRRTDIAPAIGDDGVVCIETAYDGLSGLNPRNSIHFSLESTVVSHALGNWEDSTYTVVDSLGSVLKNRQRLPENLDPFDTWFSQNPGEVLLMPSARIFKADKAHQGAPTEEGNMTTYNPDLVDINDLLSQEKRKRNMPKLNIGSFGDDISEPSKPMLALIKQLGIPLRMHHYSDEAELARNITRRLRIAAGDLSLNPSKLKVGNLNLDWKRLTDDFSYTSSDVEEPTVALTFEPGDLQNLNAILVHVNPATRRCFYASGLSVPRVSLLEEFINPNEGPEG